MASSIEANVVRWKLKQGGLPEYERYSTLVYNLCMQCCYSTIRINQKELGKKSLFQYCKNTYIIFANMIYFGLRKGVRLWD